MTTNLELKRAAREQLRGKWGMAAVTTLVYGAIMSVASYVSWLIAGSMELGYVNYLRQVNRGEEAQVETLFSGFKHFVQVLVAGLLKMIAIAIGTCLLIVPGIIVAFGLSLTFYIMSDNPEMDAVSALKRSWELMRGNKMRLFGLWFRFIGWWLLIIVTLGIAAFWALPYWYLAAMNFYDEIKKS